MRNLILSISLCVMTLPAHSALGKLIACVGASNTYGYALVNRESECYPSQLATMLQAYDPNWEVRNFGVNGTGILQRGLRPYIKQASFTQALQCNPDIVLIQLGGNDSLPANWIYKSDFLEDFLVLIDAFLALSSQPQIYVLTSPPFYSNPFGLDYNIIRNEIGPLIAQLPTYRNVQLIDLYVPMEHSRNLFQSDGIHFTVEGAGVVAEVVAATILGVCRTPDFNRDGKVEIQDLLILIEHWQQAEISFDIAPPSLGDGIVDAIDLAALMEYWGCEVKDLTLAVHWKLDEAEGIIAYDSAGVNDAVVVGGTEWQPSDGRVNGALQLDGVDGYAVTGKVLNPANGPFSVLAWVKGGAPGQIVLSQLNGANWLGTDLDLGCLMTELIPPAVGRFTPQPLESGIIITDGQWYHVGFIWNGAYRILYVDSIEVAKDTAAQNPLKSADGGLYIGASKEHDAGTFFSGLIDDVRIYNVALSAEQIAALTQ
ncbi:LamG-like jellyroll fold domain-containing protein [Planctomycetota bacterium]